MNDRVQADAQDFERFVAGAALSAHPVLRAWYGDAALTENVRLWLDPDLRLVGDADAARAFAAACPVPGRDASEYGNRVVSVGDGVDVVAGVRFRPGATMTPWIGVVAASRPVADASEWTRIAHALAAEFAGFAPKWVGFFAADERLDPPGRLPGDVVLAARVDDLRAAAASSDDSVALRRANAASCVDQYLGLYSAFHAERPGNEELAHAEDIESLAGFEADGGLFEIRVNGFFAGFCGARRASSFGVRGWVGGEIILANRFRGHGLAAPVHLRMAEAIPASEGDGIWATAHEENAPSWRAGLSAGYRVIGRRYRIATGA